jgi:heme-degrading monooxygenase HmoA
MTAIVVFRARVRPGVDEAYAAAGARMEELVREQPGFIDVFGWSDPSTREETTIVRFEITVATSVRQYEWTRTDA